MCVNNIDYYLFLADDSIQILWQAEEDRQAREENNSDQELRHRHRRIPGRRRRIRTRLEILLQQRHPIHQRLQRRPPALLRGLPRHDGEAIAIQSLRSDRPIPSRNLPLVMERRRLQPQELRSFPRLRPHLRPPRQADVISSSKDRAEFTRQFPLRLFLVVLVLSRHSSEL